MSERSSSDAQISQSSGSTRFVVEQFREACAEAGRLGICLRQEWLRGCRGGACEIAGKRWVFIDLSLSPAEQLQQLTEALAQWRGEAVGRRAAA